MSAADPRAHDAIVRSVQEGLDGGWPVVAAKWVRQLLAVAVARGEALEQARAELASRRSGVATAPAVTPRWANAALPAVPSAAGIDADVHEHVETAGEDPDEEFADEQRLDDWAEMVGADLRAKWRDRDGALYARDAAGQQYVVRGESWPVPVSGSTPVPPESKAQALYEMQVPPPPPARVKAVRPTGWSDGPWRRDGGCWARGRERLTWTDLMWKYNHRGRGVEPVPAPQPPPEDPMTPTVPDGPDTELAAAIGYFRGGDLRADYLARGGEYVGRVMGEAAATIVRAVLARPAAGRDLTAQDGTVSLDDLTPTRRERVAAAALHRHEMAAVARQVRDGIPTTPHDDVDQPENCLGCLAAASVVLDATEDARPAVARPDGQPPAWDRVVEPGQTYANQPAAENILRNEADDPDRPELGWAIDLALTALHPTPAAPTHLALLARASEAISALTKSCIAVKPRLDQPYPDDARWTPWTRWFRDRLADAGQVRQEIRAVLAASQPAGTAAPDGWGVALIRTERARQVAEEARTPEHDAEHREDELAEAAACYATPSVDREARIADGTTPALWPWDPASWKPTPGDRVRELTKAGALIAAEIDRVLAGQPVRDTPIPTGDEEPSR